MFLPAFSFSPEEIFSGDILLFDVDFFNPVEDMYVVIEISKTTSRTTQATISGGYPVVTEDAADTEKIILKITDGLDINEYLTNIKENSDPEIEDNSVIGYTDISYTYVSDASVGYYFYYDDDGNQVVTSAQNTALDLQSLVSQWYYAIRNIAIVASMSVLLYIGIRMLLASVSQEKAKYKQMLIDWVVGVCLLFFLHYIMAFSVSIVESFNDIIKTTTSAADIESAIEDEDADGSYGHLEGFDYITILEDDDDGKISEKLESLGMSEFIEDDQIIWPTNLMGLLRLKAQVSYGDMDFVGYGLCYVVLVLFTVYFTYVYLRRVLYMAFLTMIAPLVALTYPIDKISDGQAQGFNKWLKEYIFNLLLQPLHLLLYTILVTSAYELVSTNVIYALVCIGFMIPAEKLMRSLFGFEKATTPGSAAGAVAGATLLNSGLQKLLHKPPKKDGESGGGKSLSGNGSDNSTPRLNYKASSDDDDSSDDDGNSSDSNMASGGPSAADAAMGSDEDPITRMEREALEEQLADGQIDESELTDEQRMLLQGNNTGSEVDSEDDEDTNGLEDTNIRMQREALEEQLADGQIDESELTDEQRALLGKENQSTKDKKKEKHAADIGTLVGIGRVANLTARQTGRKILKAIPKVVRKGAKYTAGAALGTTAAVAGATIGIATGDPSRAASFAAGGAVAGAALGASTIKVDRSNTKTAEQIARERAFWGDDYYKHIAEENKKNWKKDNDKRAKLEANLGAERTKELYEDGTIDKYLENGVDSAKDIAALEQLQKNEKISFKDALVAHDAHGKYGDITGQKPKDRSDIKQGYVEQFQSERCI